MSGALVACGLVAALVAGAVVVARGPAPEQRLAQLDALSAVHDASWLERVLAELARRVRRVDEDVVGPLVEACAAALRTGLPPEVALREALAEVPSSATVLRSTAACVEVDGDVVAALAVDRTRLRSAPERRAADALAACWSVAREHGGRLADALDRIGDARRADRLHTAHVRAQLAGPRATAWLLAALPLFGLLLSSGLGLDPVAVLLTDPIGRIALVAGLALDVAGLVWTTRIARAAEHAA